MTSELTTYQTTQLAELDKQMAVWNQRLSTLDQQIQTVSQNLQESTQKLKTNLNNLVAAADSWLEQQSTSSPLVKTVTSLRDKVKTLYSLDLTDATVVDQLATLAEDLQNLSTSLVSDLSAQAQVFSESLDKAAADLATHYGIQI